MLRHPYQFIPNSSDDLHCFQAALRMTWEGLLGDTLDEDEIDELTRFRPGEQSWPFAGMLAAAEAGVTVVNIEDFDPVGFATNPREELLRTSGGDSKIVDHVFRVSDVPAQQAIVESCLAHSNITFEQRIPAVYDLTRFAAEPGVGVICNVNYRRLAGRDGYNGHFMLVESGACEGEFCVQDPGSPPLENHRVTVEQFVDAWTSPYPKLANLLVLCIAE